ncbi:Cysteine--tRNA ligase [bioreactor metagenome]|uniref:Cysteine--tRNA ligase n=1 Tax=bioreactor metagenome TaxID=1076179 RepID=A0A645G0P3_9ZZZZ
MEHKLLGLPFDIHTGGIDLKFPHHEDEIAQSKAGYGIEPTNFWCHNEFLEVEGTKMSKSAGNFFTLRDLENKDIDPIDVRYAMLAMHYRTKFNFTFNGIYAAKKARLRVQEYINHLSEIFYQKNKIDNINENCIIETQEIQQLSENILEDLANDLHTPKALAKIFTFINNHNVNELDPNAASDMFVLLWKINHIFSVWKFPDSLESELIKNSNDEPEIVESVPENISILAQQRLQAKKDKDFTEADRLRNEINSLGYTIIDTKDGFEIKKN